MLYTIIVEVDVENFDDAEDIAGDLKELISDAEIKNNVWVDYKRCIEK